MEIRVEMLQKAKNTPDTPLFGVYHEGFHILLRDTFPPMFTTCLLIIVSNWKQPRCTLSDEWII